MLLSCDEVRDLGSSWSADVIQPETSASACASEISSSAESTSRFRPATIARKDKLEEALAPWQSRNVAAYNKAIDWKLRGSPTAGVTYGGVDRIGCGNGDPC